MTCHCECVLVVDDDHGAILLLRRAMKKAGVPHPVVEVHDGLAAVHYLKGTGPYADRLQHPVPALVLLDLKMPLLDGFGLLEWLQGHPEWKHLPVVIFSTSDLKCDRETARRLGATDYVQKPGRYEDLMEVVRELHARWLRPRQQAAA